jgi:hypothetical protein
VLDTDVSMQLKNTSTIALKMKVEQLRADGMICTPQNLDPELAKYVRNVSDALFKTRSSCF